MRNTILFLFALLSLSFFACQEPLQDVADEAAPPADTLGTVVMNDSVWRVDSVNILDIWRLYWQSDEIRPDSAIYYCREIIRIGEPVLSHRFDSNLYVCFAKGHGGIGFNLMMKGRLDEAMTYTLKGYELIKRQFGENHIRNTELFVGVSSNYVKRGDYEQAIVWQKKGLAVMKALFPHGGHWYFGNKLLNIGEYYGQKGDLGKALEYYFLVLKRAKEFPEETLHQPRVLIRIANCYIKLGQYHTALSYLKESENACESLSKTSKEPFAPTFIFRMSIAREFTTGLAYENLGEFHLAEKHFNEAISKSGDTLPYPGICYYEFGNLEKKRHNWQKSREYYNKALSFWEDKKLQNEEDQVAAKTGIAETYRSEGNIDSCILEYQKILNYLSPQFSSFEFSQVPDINKLTPSVLLLNTLSERGNALLKSFRQSKQSRYLPLAFSTYLLATELADKMRLGYKWQSSKQSLSERVLPIFEGAISTAFEMYNMTGDGKYKEKAFALTERSKAFTLLENLRNDDARSHSGISQELFNQEEKVNQDIAMYERFILEEEHNAENPDSSKIYYWNGKLVDLKKAQDSLTSVLEQNYPEYHRLKYENPIASTAQIQQKLRSDETLIEYFLGDSTLFTFTVNHTGLNYHQQQIDSTFFNTVNHLRHFASTPSRGAAWTTNYRKFTAGTRYLCQILLEPALGSNSSLIPHPSSLIIIPDGILGYLPFNLLLTAEPDPAILADYSYRGLPYLVSNHDIRYEYSATLLLESQKMRSKVKDWLPRNNEPAYCGFAPSYGDGEAIASRGEEDSLKLAELFTGLVRGKLGALSFTQPEIQEASVTMSGKAFEAEAATEAEFKRQASQANILHLAMHALTNDKEPLFSQLVFTQDDGDTIEDGRLHAYELQNMKLKADLAVLSACNTGAGKLQRGEGVMSLSRAFKFAGCPNVVMSLWQADDLSTKTIVTDFFKKLKSGMGKDQALCQAQRDFLTGIADQNLTHPYYWSALMLIGDGEPVQHHLPWWVIAAGLLIFLGIVLAASRILARKNYLSRSTKTSIRTLHGKALQ